MYSPLGAKTDPDNDLDPRMADAPLATLGSGKTKTTP